MYDRIKILIAEDSEADALLALRAIKRHGVHAVAVIAETEASFRDALLADRPHLVISDYSMPSFSGETAYAIAQELAPGVPFIFLSGSVEHRAAGSAHVAQATACLDKCELAKLGAIVAEVLGWPGGSG